ncbi:MAG TPA: hypothetical protein VMV17_00480 [Streptosporangiaceae bacterium]|nr:hypothetical protein [Streptosporangiaceae bacterium]
MTSSSGRPADRTRVAKPVSRPATAAARTLTWSRQQATTTAASSAAMNSVSDITCCSTCTW